MDPNIAQGGVCRLYPISLLLQTCSLMFQALQPLLQLDWCFCYSSTGIAPGPGGRGGNSSESRFKTAHEKVHIMLHFTLTIRTVQNGHDLLGAISDTNQWIITITFHWLHLFWVPGLAITQRYSRKHLTLLDLGWYSTEQNHSKPTSHSVKELTDASISCSTRGRTLWCTHFDASSLVFLYILSINPNHPHIWMSQIRAKCNTCSVYSNTVTVARSCTIAYAHRNKPAYPLSAARVTRSACISCRSSFKSLHFCFALAMSFCTCPSVHVL